jgi:DNA-binding CsgD family transcriptional regulator
MDAVGAARLAHPLYGEVLRGMVGPALRRAHSRRLSEALIATESSSTGHELPFPGAGNELRLAAWSLEAGLPVQVEVLVAASRAAQAVFEHPGAVRLARAAVEAGGGVPASLALAAALRGNSEPDAAEQVLDGIEDTIRDDPRRLAYLRLRTDNLVGDLGHPQDALAVLERSRGWAADRSWQDVVEALSLAALLNEGRYQEIADRGTRLLARDDLVAATRFTALTPFALALVELGRPADALTVADERVQLAAELAEQFPRHLRDTMQIRLSAMDSLGRWGEMEAYGRAYYEHAVRQHDQETLGRAAFLLGSVAAARGQLDTARRWLAEAVGHLEIRDGLGLQVGCAARLAKILAVSGHPAEAGRMLEHARTMKAARGREQDRYLDLPVAEVWVRAAGGDLAGARAAARHYARSFAGRPRVQALLLHDAYRLGDHSNDLVDELREATAGTDSPLHAAFTAHASARTGGELDRASRRFAELGANLLAAEAAAEAAAAHAAAHDQQSSRRAASTAARLLGQCAGARTPALISLAAPTLTARERQVALLAADGLSNAAIARQLQLSERTVESHLYRAGDKLGITRRTEFATALH